jgi:hypothetical protein
VTRSILSIILISPSPCGYGGQKTPPPHLSRLRHRCCVSNVLLTLQHILEMKYGDPIRDAVFFADIHMIVTVTNFQAIFREAFLTKKPINAR